MYFWVKVFVKKKNQNYRKIGEKQHQIIKNKNKLYKIIVKMQNFKKAKIRTQKI